MRKLLATTTLTYLLLPNSLFRESRRQTELQTKADADTKLNSHIIVLSSTVRANIATLWEHTKAR